MKKADYFIRAINHGLYKDTAWVYSAFAVIDEDPEEWKKDSYQLRIIQTKTGVFFLDPDKFVAGDLFPFIKLDDCKPNEAPFSVKEKIQLKAGDIENLDRDVTTTYGNILFNATALISAFGSKFKYLEGKVTASQLESLILPRLEDTPKEGVKRDDEKLYVDEYLKFCDGMFHLTNYNSICVPAATRKIMVPPPGLKEFRQKLMNQYEGQLNDPAVLAQISEQLVNYYAKHLEGDRSEGFLISKKQKEVVLRKLFLTMGAEPGLDDKTTVEPIMTSLSEGWDITKFPEMNNSLRAGSFNRGFQTQLGGELVKWLLRISANVTIGMKDCGTHLGYPILLTESNYKRYQGFNVVVKAGHETLTETVKNKYLNRKVMIRTPLLCKAGATDYCEVCCGPRLAAHPKALSMSLADCGSALMSIFMSAAHAKGLNVVDMDIETELF